jgi:hypothetical protein
MRRTAEQPHGKFGGFMKVGPAWWLATHAGCWGSQGVTGSACVVCRTLNRLLVAIVGHCFRDENPDLFDPSVIGGMGGEEGGS